MATVEAWPVHWAPYGRRGGVACPLGPAWPPWGCGRFPRPRMADVGAWPAPVASYVRRGGMAGSLGPIWLSWGRGRSTGSVWQRGGVAGHL